MPGTGFFFLAIRENTITLCLKFLPPSPTSSPPLLPRSSLTPLKTNALIHLLGIYTYILSSNILYSGVKSAPPKHTHCSCGRT